MINCTNERKTVFEYCGLWQVRLEDTKIWDPINQCLDQTHPKSGIAQQIGVQNPRTTIPNFQRGIEWDFSTLLECINSSSPILGTAVYGRTMENPLQFCLLDGLQRFAAFTFLLHHLDNVLFTPPRPDDPNPWSVHPTIIAAHFVEDIQRDAQQYSGFRRTIAYNHEALLLHNRTIIAKSYDAWVSSIRDRVSALVNSQDDNFELEESHAFFTGLRQFLIKPIYVQDMSGFSGMGELISTFIGLNTVRVELTAADVCRSILVDELQAAKAIPDVIATIENQFNELLLRSDGRIRSNFSPLIKVLESDWHVRRTHKLVPALFSKPKDRDAIVAEFQNFADFINFFWEQNHIGYWPFIKNIGDNPAIATMLFYYHDYRRAGVREFPEPRHADMHRIALAYLRKALDGGVGDTLPLTIAVARGDVISVDDFTNRVVPDRSGPLTSAVPNDWLRNALDAVRNVDSARVVFNACLLPAIRAGAGFGDSFEPIAFRAGADNWAVDHLIPQNSFDRPNNPTVGDPYKTTLRNLCPAIGSDNSSYKATDCAVKLTNPGYYDTYLTDLRKLICGKPHPYILELLRVQGDRTSADLNVPQYLCTDAPAGPRSPASQLRQREN